LGGRKRKSKKKTPVNVTRSTFEDEFNGNLSEAHKGGGVEKRGKVETGDRKRALGGEMERKRER